MCRQQIIFLPFFNQLLNIYEFKDEIPEINIALIMNSHEIVVVYLNEFVP